MPLPIEEWKEENQVLGHQSTTHVRPKSEKEAIRCENYGKGVYS